MISLLKGTIFLRNDPYIIVDVQGVGYKVLATSDILNKIHVNDTVTVFIYTHVREDALELYGFSSHADLMLFEQLIGVSGVGPKTAIGIFAVGSGSEIVSAILSSNVEFFTGVPRLGRKNAQKIIIELKSKIGDRGELVLANEQGGNEVMEALRQFGYSQKEVSQALQSINGEGESTEEKIRLALKYLGK